MSVLSKLVAFLSKDLLSSINKLIKLSKNSKQTQFYSQASQDQFVHALLYGLLGKQDEGYYLEVIHSNEVLVGVMTLIVVFRRRF